MVKFLEKLRALPETKKKIILAVIVVIVGLILAYFWINSSIDRLSKLKIEDSFGKLGNVLNDAKLPEMPNPETPATAQTADETAECKKENEVCGYSFGDPIGDCCEELVCVVLDSNLLDAEPVCKKISN